MAWVITKHAKWKTEKKNDYINVSSFLLKIKAAEKTMTKPSWIATTSCFATESH